MQFSSVFLAAAAFALTNAASFTLPASFFTQSLTAGTTYNLTWTDASGDVTLLLKNGDPSNLQTVSTISSGLTGTSFAWTPSVSLPDGEYAFEIDDSSNIPNYSKQFALTGGAASASTTATTSGSTTTASSTTLTTSASTTGNLSTTSTTKTASSASKTGTTSSSTGTSTSTSTPNTNSAASFASPLAFVFLAFAAMVTLN